jgi:hypothetical protein
VPARVDKWTGLEGVARDNRIVDPKCDVGPIPKVGHADGVVMSAENVVDHEQMPDREAIIDNRYGRVGEHVASKGHLVDCGLTHERSADRKEALPLRTLPVGPAVVEAEVGDPVVRHRREHRLGAGTATRIEIPPGADANGRRHGSRRAGEVDALLYDHSTPGLWQPIRTEEIPTPWSEHNSAPT